MTSAGGGGRSAGDGGGIPTAAAALPRSAPLLAAGLPALASIAPLALSLDTPGCPPWQPSQTPPAESKGTACADTYTISLLSLPFCSPLSACVGCPFLRRPVPSCAPPLTPACAQSPLSLRLRTAARRTAATPRRKPVSACGPFGPKTAPPSPRPAPSRPCPGRSTRACAAPVPVGLCRPCPGRSTGTRAAQGQAEDPLCLRGGPLGPVPRLG